MARTPAPDAAAVPEPVVLAPHPGLTPSPRPAVRIYLGTEPAQHRAERVFFYALEQVRDPARRYEVYRMCRLPGFDARAWRTGFTNYRFAIPELAGRSGRAIYNDVDQIYTADPGALFDLPLGAHGYLALSPHDTAVMLLDCARMAGPWSHAAARRGDKKALLAAAAPLWGALPPAWHGRDEEYQPGVSKLLHYTALHLQPWHPAPRQYSYHPHPLAALWLDLERAANAQGYEVHNAGSPSSGFAAGCARLVVASLPAPWPPPAARALAARLHCRAALVLGPAGALWPGLEAVTVGPQALRTPGEAADLCAAVGLEALPADDLPWLIGALFARARRLVHVAADLGHCPEPAQTADYWRALLRRIARRHPRLCWRLDVVDAAGRVYAWEADFATRQAPPRVWVLTGRHAGDNAQLETLAQALGWPWEARALRFRPLLYRLPGWLLGARRLALAGATPPLAPPWPEVVLAAGRRSAPVARHLARRGGSRSVLLGRPRGPLRAFDLVLTTPQYGLPVRANTLHLPAPLGGRAAAPEALVASWRARLAHLPRPWTLVLVGGPSRPYAFDADIAVALARAVNAAARSGALLVSTGPRTPPDAAAALGPALRAPAEIYHYRPGDPDNPYRAWLALADGVVVTGESASMLADAVTTGKAVAVYPLPKRRAPWQRLLPWLERRLGLRSRAAGSRGTERQQHVLGRAYDRLLAAGIVVRERELEAVHHALGVRPLPEGLTAPPLPGARALALAHDEAAARVRELLTCEHPA